MTKARRLRLTTAAMGPELSEAEYVNQALEQFKAFSLIPGIVGPYIAESLVWQDVRYYYVHARDYIGQRRLIEVFVVTDQRKLEAVLAFQYPLPFRELFPDDFSLLHSDDPWAEPTQVQERA
ncbi:hypothetical protein [Cupriavidus necator]|uniref:Uncharacterized protein n=1 Tax=Cupriavidus pinatubonensis (strain JMP 134 / LMG 1197) TaxID=264198 RepID=Q46NG7_CUPPJ|nr:hypothetical protein [Cupriavidus necator]